MVLRFGRLDFALVVHCNAFVMLEALQCICDVRPCADFVTSFERSARIFGLEFWLNPNP